MPTQLDCFSLAGQTAAVTGSSSGIGRAIALALAQAGAAVVVHAAKNQAGAEQTAAAIRALGGEATVLLADFNDQTAQDRFVEQAWSWRVGIDVWINNAGADVLTGGAAKLSYEAKLALLLQIDVSAALRLSRAVGLRMKKRQRGAIVNIGWDQAEHGMAGESGELFAAAKGAVMAMTRSLARSFAPEVRVNAVAPGWIKTTWGEKAGESWQRRAVEESLLGRWGTPEDVARAVLFLCSPAAAFITGHVLPVNGGFRGAAEV